MRKGIISAIAMLCVLNFAIAADDLEPKDKGGNNKSKTGTKDNGSSKEMLDNFKYVKQRSDLSGYALQLASFNSLDNAREFAKKLVKKGSAEKEQLFIYSMNIDGRKFHKVFFGITKTDDSIRGKQKYFLENGQFAFVKEFR